MYSRQQKQTGWAQFLKTLAVGKEGHPSFSFISNARKSPNDHYCLAATKKKTTINKKYL
jgi:hypothetical protein